MYQVNLDEDALRFLRKLDKSEKNKVSKKISKLSNNPELGKPLLGNMAGIRSLRADKFRVLYRILKDKLIIVVIEIGHRKNVYG